MATKQQPIAIVFKHTTVFPFVLAM